VALSQLAVSRLGKDVVDLERVSVSYPGEDGGTREVLRDVTWLIAPGERTGILGVNGAGKSTLLGLVTGDVRPTAGRVKRGKTVRIATLTQQLSELDDVAEDRVSDVVASKRTTYVADGREMTPGQLLERLGFTNEQLATPVKDLSGGQKRRLQLLMILLDEPNVLILDEPSNDLDTDMLAAMEDLLDTWPGTLLVVSHDRYLLERVTDQQYAVIDGRFRHLPRGVEQYLELASQSRSGSAAGSASASNPLAATGASSSNGKGTTTAGGAPRLTGAQARAAQKEVGAIERKLEKLAAQVEAAHAEMAAHDQSDYTGLAGITARLTAVQEEIEELELRWLELSEDLV
ncbi:MAG: ATP-binding cassette domain-containing protein, partial [Actinomycetota bacterium]